MYHYLTILLLCSISIFSQNSTEFVIANSDKATITKAFFTQFDITIPLRGNSNRLIDDLAVTNNNWFLPDGLCSKIGIGYQKPKWIALSAHTGIDWFWSQKLVTVPLYANLRLSKAISSDARLVLQAGLGHGFVIGRGNINGNYQKFSIGFETDSDITIFLETIKYDFQDNKQLTAFSLGISQRLF